MKRISTFLAVALLVLAFAACQNEHTVVKDLNTLIETIEEDTDVCSKEELKEMKAEFARICDELAEKSDKYTPEEKEEIDRKVGRCAALISKKAMQQATQAIEEMSSNMENVIDGFLEEFSNED